MTTLPKTTVGLWLTALLFAVVLANVAIYGSTHLLECVYEPLIRSLGA